MKDLSNGDLQRLESFTKNKELEEAEELGKYKGESGEVTAEISLKLKLIGTENVGGWNTKVGYGVDYYFSDISFYSLNYDLGRFNKYMNKVNFQFGCDCIGTIFEMLRENSDSIANLLNPRKPNKWDIVKCIFSLEDQTKHLYEERYKAKEKRKEELKEVVKEIKK